MENANKELLCQAFGTRLEVAVTNLSEVALNVVDRDDHMPCL